VGYRNLLVIGNRSAYIKLQCKNLMVSDVEKATI